MTKNVHSSMKIAHFHQLSFQTGIKKSLFRLAQRLLYRKQADYSA
jgi:hypothetical protein